MTVRRVSQPLVILAAAGFVVAGVVLLVMAAAPTRGWVSYAPVNEPPPTATWAYFAWQQQVGAGLVVVGLVALAGVVGYRFGRSRRGLG